MHRTLAVLLYIYDALIVLLACIQAVGEEVPFAAVTRLDACSSKAFGLLAGNMRLAESGHYHSTLLPYHCLLSCSIAFLSRAAYTVPYSACGRYASFVFYAGTVYVWDAKYSVEHIGQEGSPKTSSGCAQLVVFAKTAAICGSAATGVVQESLRSAAIHCTATLAGGTLPVFLVCKAHARPSLKARSGCCERCPSQHLTSRAVSATLLLPLY